MGGVVVGFGIRAVAFVLGGFSVGVGAGDEEECSAKRPPGAIFLVDDYDGNFDR